MVTFDPTSRPAVEIVRHEVVSDVAPDPELQAVVGQYLGEVEAGMLEEIGCVECDLEGRFSCIR